MLVHHAEEFSDHDAHHLLGPPDLRGVVAGAGVAHVASLVERVTAIALRASAARLARIFSSNKSRLTVCDPIAAAAELSTARRSCAGSLNGGSMSAHGDASCRCAATTSGAARFGFGLSMSHSARSGVACCACATHFGF